MAKAEVSLHIGELFAEYHSCLDELERLGRRIRPLDSDAARSLEVARAMFERRFGERLVEAARKVRAARR